MGNFYQKSKISRISYPRSVPLIAEPPTNCPQLRTISILYRLEQIGWFKKKIPKQCKAIEFTKVKEIRKIARSIENMMGGMIGFAVFGLIEKDTGTPGHQLEKDITFSKK